MVGEKGESREQKWREEEVGATLAVFSVQPPVCPKCVPPLYAVHIYMAQIQIRFFFKLIIETDCNTQMKGKKEKKEEEKKEGKE